MAVSRVSLSSITQGFPKSRSFLDGNSAYIPSSFESIATATGTGSNTTITFSSIPSTYKHLQIRSIFKDSTSSTSSQYLYINFNSNTSVNNYSWHNLKGNGTNASASGVASGTSIIKIENAGASDPGFPTKTIPNIYGVSIIDILDYASSTKNKTLRAISGTDVNNAIANYGGIVLNSGLWLSTSAITSITLTNPDGSTFMSGSTFALYGITG